MAGNPSRNSDSSDDQYHAYAEFLGRELGNRFSAPDVSDPVPDIFFADARNFIFERNTSNAEFLGRELGNRFSAPDVSDPVRDIFFADARNIIFERNIPNPTLVEGTTRQEIEADEEEKQAVAEPQKSTDDVEESTQKGVPDDHDKEIQNFAAEDVQEEEREIQEMAAKGVKKEDEESVEETQKSIDDVEKTTHDDQETSTTDEVTKQSEKETTSVEKPQKSTDVEETTVADEEREVQESSAAEEAREPEINFQQDFETHFPPLMRRDKPKRREDRS